MAEKPQQQTLSVRISETLRNRLERARQMLAEKTDEYVSTSEIAKQLLESSRDDRLDVVAMLDRPTEAMSKIRAKVAEGDRLSKAEWTVVAYFLQIGESAFSTKTLNRISVESTIGLLEAFLAVLRIRRTSKKNSDERYRFHLYAEGKADQGAEVETIAERNLRALRKDGEDMARKIAPGQCLYEALEEEQFPSRERLNESLLPYWPILWRVASRGHFIQQGHPVPLRVVDSDEQENLGGTWGIGIPSVFEGGFVLGFTVGNETDLSLLLSLPESRLVTYPMAPAPMIAEFRAMLERWDVTTKNSLWKGHHFFGYTAEVNGSELQVWFRAQSNGISFGFSLPEWESIRTLFRRAWEMPELQRAWQEGAQAYGEL